MKTARRISQVLFFILFLYTFILSTYPLQSLIPLNFFLILSPLSAVITILATHRLPNFFVPALLVIVTTVLIGRYFCGFICPLGACLDLSHRLFFHKSGKKRYEPPHKLRFVKYYLLVAIIASSLLSLSFGYLFEPVTIIFRTFTMGFFPILYLFWNNVAVRFPDIQQFSLAPASIVTFQGALFFLLFFGAVIALEGVSRRFWCRIICPMGAFLGACSHLFFLGKKVSQTCIECGLCRTHCKTGAIFPGNKDFIPSECIYCFECESLCPERAISFGYKVSLKTLQEAGRWIVGKKQGAGLESGFSRRGFLISCAGGVFWALTGEVDYGRIMKHSRLIRPPGALPERKFISRCIRCGECMKVCVTNGLQPAMLEAGLSGIWTPRLVPLRGYCEENCNFCSQICPTGAIQPIGINEKKTIQIGVARINRSTCLAWDQSKVCLVCDEHCSYKAVHWKKVEGESRPFVDQKKCVGCGICENKCPTGPDPAIVVYAQSEEKRILEKNDRTPYESAE